MHRPWLRTRHRRTGRLPGHGWARLQAGPCRCRPHSLPGACRKSAPSKAIALAHPEEAPKGHHHIGDLARDLVDHEVEYRPELLAGAVIYGGALDLVRGDEAAGLVNSDAVARRVERP